MDFETDDDEDFLMGRDIICFSNDWHGDPYSKMHIMRRLAQHNQILWINSIGSRAPNLSRRDLKRLVQKLHAATKPLENPLPNLYVLNPIAMPFFGSRLMRAITARMLAHQVKSAAGRLGFRHTINWVFVPTAAVVAGKLGEEFLIYHCVDEFSAFQGVAAKSVAELEKDVMRRADLVIVSAERLLTTKSEYNSNTVLVRHGVDHDLFRRALADETEIPESIRSLPRPIIGFFGLIGSDWIDVGLIDDVSRHFSSGSIVLIGSVTMDICRLKALPNVHVLDRVPYTTLPEYCKGFDVAMIPFVQSALTESCNPLKVWQYLAAGLPVVSSPIPEVVALPECRVGRNSDEFIGQIEAALKSPGPCRSRSDLMKDQTWDARVEEIRQHVGRTALNNKNARDRRVKV